MLLVMIISQITVLVLTIISQFFSKVDDSIEISEIHTKFGLTCRIVTVILTVITIILLSIVFIYLSKVSIEKHKEHTRRRENME